MLPLPRAPPADREPPILRVSVRLDKGGVDARHPGRHAASVRIPHKLKTATLRIDAYPPVQRVVVVARRLSIVDLDQIALRIVRIAVYSVIGDIADGVVGESRRVYNVVALVETDAQHRPT